MPTVIGGGQYNFKPTATLRGYNNLGWIGRNKYDPATWVADTSPYGVGTIRGGLSARHAYDLSNPSQFEVISPVRGLSTPITAPGNRRPRTGNFTLDLIDWNNSLSQITGASVGRDPAGMQAIDWGPQGAENADSGFAPTEWLASNDIDPFTNMPRRLMDKALWPVSVIGQMAGFYKPGDEKPGEVGKGLPFQSSPYYWQWVSTATPEQRAQEAKALALAHVSGNRAEPFERMLLEQFNRDYATYDYKSSGDQTIDYVAKKAIQNNPNWWRTYVNPEVFAPEVGQVGPAGIHASYAMGGGYGLAEFVAQAVPFIGSNIAGSLDPIRPETEAAWLEATVEERKRLLETAGYTTMGVSMATLAIPMMGAARGIRFVEDAAKVEALLAGKTAMTATQAASIAGKTAWGARTTGRALNSVNVLMGVGLANMTAQWAIESFAPTVPILSDYAEAVDASRVISDSSFAAVLNEAGFWVGVYGADWLYPRVKRVGGAVATAGVRGKRLFGGTPDLAFHQFMGGSQAATVLDNAATGLNLSRNTQNAAMSAEVISGLVNQFREDLVKARVAIDNGVTTGNENLAALDAPAMLKDPAERVRAWEAMMAHAQDHVVQRIDKQIEIINARAEPERGPMAAKLSQSMDDSVTKWAARRYGAIGLPRNVDEMEAWIAKRLAGLGESAALPSIRGYAGKDIEKWGAMARRVHQILFHVTHSEMLAVAEKAGEDPSRFAIFTQKTLFADEVPDLAEALVGPDGLTVMQRLIDSVEGKTTVIEWGPEKGLFTTPEQLAELMVSLQGLLPQRFRPAADGMGTILDDFANKLEQQGIWTVATKPMGVFVEEIPAGWIRLTDAARMPGAFGATRVMRTPADLLADGYRQPYPFERMGGPEFRSREPVWPVEKFGGGVWIKERPGDMPPPPTAATAYSSGRAVTPDMNSYLADPGTYSLEPYALPWHGDLEAAMRPGTTVTELRTRYWMVSQWDNNAALAGQESLVFRPGTSSLIPDSALSHGDASNVDVAPSRTTQEMVDAWESSYISEPALDPEVQKAGAIVYETFADGSIGVWAMHPVDHSTGKPWLGYDLTFPKGNVDMVPEKPAPFSGTLSTDLQDAAGHKAVVAIGGTPHMIDPVPGPDGSHALSPIREPTYWGHVLDLDERGALRQYEVKGVSHTQTFSDERMAKDWYAEQMAIYDEVVDLTWQSGTGVNISVDEYGKAFYHPPTAGGRAKMVPESLRAAAAREVREEMGMDAHFMGVLGDFTTPGGNKVRYYVAQRRSGGPSFSTTPEEIGHLELVDPRHLEKRLTQHGVTTTRDEGVYSRFRKFLKLDEEVQTGGEPLTVGGRNAGADWPVLVDQNTGQKWIFKADRGFPIKSLPRSLQLTAPLAGKLNTFLGLRVAQEIPFSWNGMDGTIQKMLDVMPAADSPLGKHEVLKADLADVAAVDPAYLDELQKIHIADWFTSQHDTNSDSILLLADGSLASVDKGQAWKFFGSMTTWWSGWRQRMEGWRGASDEDAAFRDGVGFWRYGRDQRFEHPTAGDTHLGEYLWRYADHGGVLDRGAVEDVLLKIESITDEQIDDWLGELAVAREEYQAANATPDLPGQDATEFLDEVKARRDSMRDAVNAAYKALPEPQISIPRPGEILVVKAGEMGTMVIDGPTRLNTDPIAGVVSPDFMEPALPDDKNIIASVIVEEEDGRLWMLQNERNGERWLPQGYAVPDETGFLSPDDLHEEVFSAVEKATGMSIRLEEFVDDIPVPGDATTVQRIYIARRTGGGPAFADSTPLTANNQIMLGTREQLVDTIPNWQDASMTRPAVDGWWRKRHPPEPSPTEGFTEAGFLDEPVEAQHTDSRYTSYQVLPNGSVYRSPWIDYPIPSQREVMLGNRAILSQKLDTVFRGWRTWRIMEIQKATLWRSLEAKSPAFTSSRVMLFHEGLVDLAREANLSSIQTLGFAQAWGEMHLPFANKIAKEVNSLAEGIFGVGPYLGRDGKPITIDWSREIAKAYRTSLKLNLTAGLTSSVKSMGMPGAATGYISDFIYPALRFGLSPLFKGGEWAEAYILNGMRGVNPFGSDEVAAAIWAKSGLSTAGPEFGEAASSDMMYGALQRKARRDAAFRSAAMSAPPPPGYAAEVGLRRREMNQPLPTPGESDLPSSGIMDRMFPTRERADQFFSDIPEHNVEIMIPSREDPITGKPVADVEKIRELSDRQVESVITNGLERFLGRIFRDLETTGRIEPEELEHVMRGVAYADAVFTQEEYQRLGLNAPIIHTMGYGTQGVDGLNQLENMIENGWSPIGGPASRGQRSVDAQPVQSGGASFHAGGRGSTGTHEQNMGMADAMYAGTGFWSPEPVAFMLRNERVLPRDVAMNGDRYHFFDSGAERVREQHLIPSPNAIVDILATRIRFEMMNLPRHIDSGLHSAPTDLADALANSRASGSRFDATNPIEHTIVGGGWEDIAAIFLDDAQMRDRWAEIVLRWGDQIPALRDIDVITDKSMEAAWRYAFERAGLTDRLTNVYHPSMLDESQIVPFIPDEAINHRSVNAEIYPVQGNEYHSRTTIIEMLQQALRKGQYKPETRFSVDDALASVGESALASVRKSVAEDTGQMAAENADWTGFTPGGASPAYTRKAEEGARRIADAERRVAEIQGIVDELAAWRAGDGAMAEPAVISARLNDYRNRVRDIIDLSVDHAFTRGANAIFRSLDPTSETSYLGARTQHRIMDSVMAEAATDWMDLPADTLRGETYGTTLYTGPQQRVSEALAMNHFLMRNEVRARVAPAFDGRWDAATTNSMSTHIMGRNYASEIQRLAGDGEPLPAVKVWLRGDMPGVTSSERGTADVVITVSWPHGSTPIALADMEQAWLRSGLPDELHAWTGAQEPSITELWDGPGMLWSPDPGPGGGSTGSLYIRDWSNGYSTPPRGEMRVDPTTGLWAFYPVPDTHTRALPRRVVIQRSFEMGDATHAWNLTDNVRMLTSEARAATDPAAIPGYTNRADRWAGWSESLPQLDQYRYLDQGTGRARWAYGWADSGSYYDVYIGSLAASRKSTEEAMRDMLHQLKDKPIHLNVESQSQLTVLARLRSLGELPDTLVAEKSGAVWDPNRVDPAFRAPVTEEDLASLMPRRPMAPPEPGSFDDIPGTPEHFTEQVRRTWMQKIREATGERRKALEDGFAEFWNPTPFKQMQQDRLTRKLTKDWFPDVMEEFLPDMFDLYHRKLGVPRDQIVDYLLDDRLLLDRWLATNDMDDFRKLVAHADKYGIAKGDARAEIDSLYESPAWQELVEVMRWTAKAAGEESFGVHFFSLYRSTFERSINHPLLGVYPASWAYKVAKEWFRFLYMNETFGVKIGMKPAQYIANMQRTQATAFAQDGGDLQDEFDNGPLSSTMFIFNMLMPGDWSNLPFPLSRSLRDMLRGNFNPVDHINANLFQMGVGRDIRLAGEVGKEWMDLTIGQPEPRRRNERVIEPTTAP